jgi:hypothetical protein
MIHFDECYVLFNCGNEQLWNDFIYTKEEANIALHTAGPKYEIMEIAEYIAWIKIMP